MPSYGQSLEKPSVFLGRFARQMQSNTSARASTSAAFASTWLCPFRTSMSTSHENSRFARSDVRRRRALARYIIRKPALSALFRLHAQTVCSLMAQEKQMSAPQPLVFLLRPLYHTINKNTIVFVGKKWYDEVVCKFIIEM
jgi:hypothetical protein